jgi:hypothetical protein
LKGDVGKERAADHHQEIAQAVVVRRSGLGGRNGSGKLDGEGMRGREPLIRNVDRDRLRDRFVVHRVRGLAAVNFFQLLQRVAGEHAIDVRWPHMVTLKLLHRPAELRVDLVRICRFRLHEPGEIAKVV